MNKEDRKDLLNDLRVGSVMLMASVIIIFVGIVRAPENLIEGSLAPYSLFFILCGSVGIKYVLGHFVFSSSFIQKKMDEDFKRKMKKIEEDIERKMKNYEEEIKEL